MVKSIQSTHVDMGMIQGMRRAPCLGVRKSPVC